MKEYDGVRIRSQEERLAMAYGSESEQPPPTPDWEALKTEWTRLLKTIDYADPTTPLGTAKIGIAEEFVDEQNPDFVDRGTSAWIAEDATLSAEPASVTTVPPDYRIRAFDRTDHGTMIGGVIGARHMEFQNKGGLAPRALLFHIHSSDPQIGEDIRRSFLRGVHIFNISAHFGKDRIPSSLQDRIRLHPTALFVVAAGNDVVPGRNTEICSDLVAYPVCWADKKNVLVVTATNEAGDTVLAPMADQDPVIPGANWSATSVHVAAPGVGFHAPGMNKSYVPARGSSFATPLVTALAALLYGERVFDPAAIKQRIIATADPIPGLGGKVFAGRINVRRAIEDISDSIFVRKPRDNNPGETLHADVDTASRITIRFEDGSDRVIRLADVRRVQRQGARFRIIYVDRDSIRLDMVTFPTELSSRISANAKDTGASIQINLAEWDDFIGPVPIM
jgi:Subtilase family